MIATRHSGTPSSLPNGTTSAVGSPEADWSRTAAPGLIAQKEAADALALSGQFERAYDAYAQLQQTIAAHASRDAVILSIDEAARSAQQQVFTALLQKRMTAARSAASQPAAVASSAPSDSPPAQASASPPTSQPQLPTAVAAVTAPPQGRTNQEPPVNQPAPAAEPRASEEALPPRPPVHFRTYYGPDAVTDEQIGQSIHRGVLFLQRAFHNGELRFAAAASVRPSPSWNGVLTDVGVDCLSVYALLHAGQAIGEKWLSVDAPFTKQMLARLKSYNLDMTYHRSLRAAALAVYNRPEDRAALEEDVRWLIADCVDGAYTYHMPSRQIDPLAVAQVQPAPAPNFNLPRVMTQRPPILGAGARFQWDNSNSQYGLLGVWAGAQAGISVPNTYWAAIENHWNQCQLDDGQWPYTAGAMGYLSMTDAGVASLLVARDYLDVPVIAYGMEGAPAHVPTSPFLQRGLNWLDQGDNSMPGQFNQWAGYTYYGIERVGLASGYKYFGAHDWYAEIAKSLVNAQHADGSWEDQPANASTAIATSYDLLFLSRARHPILFNKLRFRGYWNNRPHDVQNLAAFATRELERPINWQVVNLAHDWSDWMDSPILYIASDEAPKFTDTDLNKIRDFALGGGLIVTVADGGNMDMNQAVMKIAKRLFPDLQMSKLTQTDPLFSVLYQLRPAPEVWGVSNGSRLLMVHCPEDMAGTWELKWSDAGKLAYQLGLNLFLYGAGKGSLHNRLESPYIPPWPGVLQHNISVTRLRYDGNWDPEPYAWTRLDRYMSWETNTGLGIEEVPLADLQPLSTPLADLTGGASHTFSDAEVAAVKAYVAAGGVLLIDSCGGRADFAADVRQLLDKAFAGATLQPIAPTHPLLRADRPGADDLSRLVLRPYAMETVGPKTSIQVLTFGKGEVIYSPLDFTTGLLGTNTWPVIGYEPAYASALVKNAVLWADARPQGSAAAPVSAPAVP